MTPPHPRHLVATYLVALCLAVVVVYWPLSSYFFAQDDFVLIAKAAYSPVAAVTDFFESRPDHFRPLTKGAYFALTYRLFGMHATAYHLLSLLLHLFNVVMTWRVLRRLGVGELAALSATSLFALSVAYFHVLAWISCAQQLVGLALMLVSLEFGLRAMAEGTTRARWISVAAYAAALGSAEQTLMTPAILLLYAIIRPGGPGTRIPVRRAVSATVEHWALFTVYALLVVLWKTIPDSGTYRFESGINVIVNITTYVGWSFDYLMALPQKMTVADLTFSGKHVFFVALVAWHLVRGRWRAVLFGLGTFGLTILPTLFLVQHQFYLHTYISALGMTYLVALALGDVFAISRVRSGEIQYSILGIALIALAVLSFQAVRRNEHATLPQSEGYRRSFVIRRAMVARNTWESMARARDLGEGGHRVVMVYGRSSDLDRAGWNNQNVIEAMGKGALLALLYDRPGLSVEFTLEASLPLDPDGADVFIYDDLGNCRPVVNTYWQ